MWFLGGLVADDFVTSGCPPDDLCCHPSPGERGIWPFETWLPADPADLGRAQHDSVTLFNVGSVIDGTDAHSIPVSLEDIAPRSTVTVDCGAGAPTDLCAAVTVERSVVGVSMVFRFVPGSGRRNTDTTLEVYPLADGTLRARVFWMRTGFDTPPMASCTLNGGLLTSDGLLHLSTRGTWPDLGGVLELDFPGGETAVVRF